LPAIADAHSNEAATLRREVQTNSIFGDRSWRVRYALRDMVGMSRFFVRMVRNSWAAFCE
jgi:hypothetical protein